MRRFLRRRPRRVVRRRRVAKRSFKARRRTAVGRRVKAGTAAHTVETLAFGDLGVSGGVPVSYAFQVGQFSRAVAIMPHFREYRASKVEWFMDNAYNNYTAPTTTTQNDAIPYLYQKLDFTAEAPFQTIEQLQDAGIRPTACNKRHTLSYVPKVLVDSTGVSQSNQAPSLATMTQTADTAAIAGDFLVSFTGGPQPQTTCANTAMRSRNKWLPTYQAAGGAADVPSVLDNTLWWGHQWLIDQQTKISTANVTYRVLCRVHWEFRKPMNDN